MKPDPYVVLQVHHAARTEVIEAAFTVLREILIREDPPDAAGRLAALNNAHQTLTDPELRRRHDDGS
jgi:curved DNA-binding protein CbpA